MPGKVQRWCQRVPSLSVLIEDTARLAATYMRDVLLPHLLRADALLFLTPKTGHARWIAGYVLANVQARTQGHIALRDIMRAYRPLREPSQRRELLEVLDTLGVMGWLRAVPPTNEARHPTSCLVNPKLHETFAREAAIEEEWRQRKSADLQEAARHYREACVG